MMRAENSQPKPTLPVASIGSVTAKKPLPPQICPRCGGENPGDAVFCGNPACRKALGEYRYVLEELQAKARWHETLAEKVTDFVGKPYFFVVHILWFLVWVGINTGLLAIVRMFDAYPFGLLGILLAAEAIMLTGFVLITQNRQNAYANQRAELDYEVNVRTHRDIHDIDLMLQTVLERLDRLEASVREVTRPAPLSEDKSHE